MSKTAILVNAADASASLNGGSFDLGDLTNCSIHADFTGGAGNLVGTLKLQSSNDNADWIDVSGSSQAITASASHMWNVIDACYRFIRPVWTYTSGSGNLTCSLFIKENVIKGA